jgi:hypothetical protein
LNAPLLFFGLTSAALFLLSIALGIPVVVEFVKTGLVQRLRGGACTRTRVVGVN